MRLNNKKFSCSTMYLLTVLDFISIKISKIPKLDVVKILSKGTFLLHAVLNFISLNRKAQLPLCINNHIILNNNSL